jgi:hypothetical protein
MHNQTHLHCRHAALDSSDRLLSTVEPTADTPLLMQAIWATTPAESRGWGHFGITVIACGRRLRQVTYYTIRTDVYCLYHYFTLQMCC